MAASPAEILGLLRELEEWMRLEDCPPVDWVVCGGAALGLQNLQDRPTRDVDVLGRWDEQRLGVVSVETFPQRLVSCLRRVAANHPELAGMEATWVNPGPGALVQAGLPVGWEQRVSMLRVGERMTLRLLGRDDLVALKVYAAADDRGRRQVVHFGDLETLAPTFGELERAIEWLGTMPDFEEKRLVVKYVIERLGYEDLAYYV
jgi:hypothetical protein